MTRPGAGPEGAGTARKGGRGPGGGRVGDDPARVGPGSRLVALNEPRPVTVLTDQRGVPTDVATEGRRPRPVEAVRESWRIDDEWWRRPIARLYHTVVLEDGALLTLYRDLEDGGWYLHG